MVYIDWEKREWRRVEERRVGGGMKPLLMRTRAYHKNMITWSLIPLDHLSHPSDSHFISLFSLRLFLSYFTIFFYQHFIINKNNNEVLLQIDRRRWWLWPVMEVDLLRIGDPTHCELWIAISYAGGDLVLPLPYLYS